MILRIEEDWTELVETELATADAPPSGESITGVASAYEQVGMIDVALTALQAAPRFGVDKISILPELLRGYRKRRQFVELNSVVKEGLAVVDRGTRLRRELAIALESLGQMLRAEVEWAAVIQSEGLSDADWLRVARFVMINADEHSLALMMSAVSSCETPKDNHFAAYCTARHLITVDHGEARRALTRIDPARLSDGEILLDLAIQSFRLGEFAKAETAAICAIERKGAPAICRSVLSSIRSFRGDVSLLRVASVSMARLATQCVIRFAAMTEHDKAAWGALYRNGSDNLTATQLNLTAEPDMVVPEDLEPVATFSVVHDGQSPDPIQLLAAVDFSWPHVLIQRRPEGDLAHLFVDAQGHKEWMWEEVRADDYDVNTASKCARRGKRSATWVDALRQLQNEEGDDDGGEV